MRLAGVEHLQQFCFLEFNFADGYEIAQGLWYDSEIQKAFACGCRSAGQFVPKFCVLWVGTRTLLLCFGFSVL